MENRVTPQGAEISPNGITVQSYTANPSDPRTGLWATSAGFTIDPERPISVNVNVYALRRVETQKAASYKALRVGPGIPTGPLNPSPVNRNPFPGWAPLTQLTWPGAPPIFSDANPTGFVLMGADVNYNNNSQIIKGCLHRDERVLTPYGYFKIGEIPDLPSRTLTEYGVRDIKGVVYQGKQSYVRVRTGLHNDIKVTPDHKMRVIKGDGTLGWKEAGSLTAGDYLLCQRGHGGMLPVDRGGSVLRWYALGHLYGDGCQLERGRLVWQVTESEKEELLPIIRDFFRSEGLVCNESSRPPFEKEDGELDCNETQYYILSSESDRGLFSEIPPYQKKGRWRESGLPEAIWSLGERQLGAFLRGLFTTDGSINNQYSISFTTKHRRVAKDVRRALHLLGIISTVNPYASRVELNGRKYISRRYGVHVVGMRSRFLFREKVGFALSRKQGRLDDYFATRKKHTDKSLLIPHATLLMNTLFPTKYLYKCRDKVEDDTSARIKHVRSGKSGLLAETALPRVIERAERLGCEGPTLALLKMYQAQGWYFDKVERVDSGYKDVEVYDLFESETRSFSCNGMIVSNCTGSPNPAAVMQGTMAVEGTIRLWRDGPIPDPYDIPGNPFTATGAQLLMSLSRSTPIPQILIKHVLLTSEEFTIQGQNSPVPRTFGFAGLGDGLSPPLSMPNI